MKKPIRLLRVLAGVLLVLLWAVPCHADALAEAVGAESSGLSRLPQGAAEALEDMSPAAADPDRALAAIGRMLQSHFRKALEEALHPAAAVTAAAMLCALVTPLNLREAGRFDYVTFGGCLAVAAAAVGDVQSVLHLGMDTVNALTDYAGALLPALTAAAAGAGAIHSAGGKYAAAALFSQLLVTVGRELIVPMICAYVAAAAAGAALGTGQLQGVSKMLQWGVRHLLRGLVLCFTAYLGFTGVLMTAADTAAVKAAKAALSTALPIVGQTLSGVSDSLVAGAELLRASLGVFGMLAVLAAAALPVLRLGLRYLVFKLAAAAVSAFTAGPLAGLIDAIGSAYGMVLGLVGAAAVMHFFAIVSLLRSVTA